MSAQVALVTGGSRGLGAALAAFLAAEGYRLILSARGAEQLQDTARRLVAMGGTVRPIPGDVTDPEHRNELIEAASEAGRLDLLVNNASDLGATPLPRLRAYPLDRLARTLAVNALAPLGLIQEGLPLLERTGGMVVNVTSDAATGGYPGWGGYGASKAALDLISATLATEMEGTGVTVVSVDPGDLHTDMHHAAFPGMDISDRPFPAVTLPFWAWLFGQPRVAVHGRRFAAQDEAWEGEI